MNRVQRSDRLAWKRLAGSIDDLRGNSQDVPVSSSRGQMSTPIRSLGLRQFLERCRAQQHPVAFNQRQI
jgi:hypothetical protein